MQQVIGVTFQGLFVNTSSYIDLFNDVSNRFCNIAKTTTDVALVLISSEEWETVSVKSVLNVN